MVRRRTIRCGPDLAEAARPRTLAIRSSSMTNWPIAGCFRNSLRVRRTWSVWRFHRLPIRPDLITVGPLPPAVEIIFQTIRKPVCGRTPITSARESLREGQLLSVSAHMHWIAPKLWSVIPTRRLLGSWRRQAPHT